MNEPRNVTDSLVRGLILSLFVAMAAYLVFAWISVSKEAARHSSDRDAKKAELLNTRAAQLRELSEYSVSYTASGAVDTTKPVAMPIDRAEQMMLKDAAAHTGPAKIRRAGSRDEARSAFPDGAALYQRDCARCHGGDASGGIVVKSISEPLRVYLTAPPLSAAGIGDGAAFAARLSGGLHTPLFGAYSGEQWRQLHGYLRILARVEP